MEFNAIVYPGRALLRLYQTIADSFFKGKVLLNSPQNAAALLFYANIALKKLEEYSSSGYSGPGMQTQMERIRMILEQLERWGY